MTNDFRDDIDLTVFSLVCEQCDAGSNVPSYDAAIIDGWTEIEYRPDLPMANYCGLCPDCRRNRQLAEQIERSERPFRRG
jgi:hypothetical protein